MRKTIVIGACGQIGTELVAALRARMGQENVIATDLRAEALEEPCFALNAMDEAALRDLVQTHEITQVYHLVAMLSATGEKMPEKAWELNMMTLFHVLNLAKEGLLKRVFWPSSIAAFGPTTANAVIKNNLRLDVHAPHPKAPSMVGAIELFIKDQLKKMPTEQNISKQL